MVSEDPSPINALLRLIASSIAQVKFNIGLSIERERDQKMRANRGLIFAFIGCVVLHGWSLYSAQAAVHFYDFVVSIYH